MNINEYWLNRGKTYYSEERLKEQFYLDQEQLFLSVVLPLNPRSVLDVGCGFGRITKVLAEAMPETDFLGVDLSPDQLANARRACSSLDNVTFLEHDLYSADPLIGGFDVVVCCEVLLHHPDHALSAILRKIFRASRVLVHDVDPNWKKEDFAAEHCFFHDYGQIYADLGLHYSTIDRGEQRILVVKTMLENTR